MSVQPPGDASGRPMVIEIPVDGLDPLAGPATLHPTEVKVPFAGWLGLLAVLEWLVTAPAADTDDAHGGQP